MDYYNFNYLVKAGMEYNFYLKNDDEYWISHHKDGYCLTRVKDGSYQSFKTSEELFEKARINGRSIIEIWEEIKEYF